MTAQAIFDAYARTPASATGWRLKIGDPGPTDLLDSPVYTRGAMTLHALRKRIGDDAFFRLLRRWGPRTAAQRHDRQFIALAERISASSSTRSSAPGSSRREAGGHHAHRHAADVTVRGRVAEVVALDGLVAVHRGDSRSSGAARVH